MPSLNKIIVIGNLGADAEMRYAPNGNPVTSFRIATNYVTNSADGQKKEETEWFTVVAWSRLAEQCQNLTKGRLVYVEGRLKSRSWQGNDGQTRFVNEIVAGTVRFLDRAPAAGLPAGEAEGEVEPENLPF